MQRRTMLAGLAASAAAPLLGQPDADWGTSVLDIHLHPRRGQGSAIEHLRGSGVTRAVLLTNLRDEDKAKQEIASHTGRFAWFASTDPAQPEAVALLRKAVEKGAIGFGELNTILPPISASPCSSTFRKWSIMRERAISTPDTASSIRC